MANVQRQCANCACTETPLWRRSPLGPKTLCNACGVRMKKGRLVFVPQTRCFVTVESPAAIAKRQRKEREARESQHRSSAPRRDRRTQEKENVRSTTALSSLPNAARPPTMPVPSHAAHVLQAAGQHPFTPHMQHHAHGQLSQSQASQRPGAITKSAVRRNRKSFKGPPGLYYLLAAIDFVETK